LACSHYAASGDISGRNALYWAGNRSAGRYYSELIARHTFASGKVVTARATKDFFTTIKVVNGRSEAALNIWTGKLKGVSQ